MRSSFYKFGVAVQKIWRLMHVPWACKLSGPYEFMGVGYCCCCFLFGGGDPSGYLFNETHYRVEIK